MGLPTARTTIQQSPYQQSAASLSNDATSPAAASAERQPSTAASAVASPLPAAAASTATPYGDGDGGKWNVGGRPNSYYGYEWTPQSGNDWNDEYVRRQFSLYPLRGVSNNNFRYTPYPSATSSGPTAAASPAATTASLYQSQSYGGSIHHLSHAEQYRTANYAHPPAAEQQSNEQQSNDGVSRSSNR